MLLGSCTFGLWFYVFLIMYLPPHVPLICLLSSLNCSTKYARNSVLSKTLCVSCLLLSFSQPTFPPKLKILSCSWLQMFDLFKSSTSVSLLITVRWHDSYNMWLQGTQRLSFHRWDKMNHSVLYIAVWCMERHWCGFCNSCLPFPKRKGHAVAPSDNRSS